MLGFFRSFQQLTTDNLSKKLFRSVSEKGNTADEELVEDDPHRPPVHWLPVALPKDHLWGDVFWSTTDLHKRQYGSGEQKPSAVQCTKGVCARLSTSHLFVNKLACVFLHVILIQIGSHIHQTNLREPKVCQLDMAHGRNQQTAGWKITRNIQ